MHYVTRKSAFLTLSKYVSIIVKGGQKSVGRRKGAVKKVSNNFEGVSKKC